MTSGRQLKASDRSRSEGTTGPNRLDDIRCTPVKFTHITLKLIVGVDAGWVPAERDQELHHDRAQLSVLAKLARSNRMSQR